MLLCLCSVLTHFILSFCGVKVFREPRKANQLDQVLSSYSSCIKVGTEILILSLIKQLYTYHICTITLVEESHVLEQGVLLTTGIILFHLDLNMHNSYAPSILHFTRKLLLFHPRVHRSNKNTRKLRAA